MEITYYAGVSLDGFIAKPDGDVAWLDDLGIPMDETGYDAFFATVDGLILGRKTYDFVEQYGSWPYGDKPSWICTNRELDVLDGVNLQAARDPNEVVNQAEELGLNHVWLVGGGQLASTFVANGLLTRIIVVSMPVLLGEGISLFGPLPSHVIVTREACEPSPHGFTQLAYRIAPTRSSTTN